MVIFLVWSGQGIINSISACMLRENLESHPMHIFNKENHMKAGMRPIPYVSHESFECDSFQRFPAYVFRSSTIFQSHLGTQRTPDRLFLATAPSLRLESRLTRNRSDEESIPLLSYVWIRTLPSFQHHYFAVLAHSPDPTLRTSIVVLVSHAQ